MQLQTITTVRELRQAIRSARQQGKSIRLVPTMGALHEGHASLIRQAAFAGAQPSGCDGNERGISSTNTMNRELQHMQPFVVVSIFVNPTQFRPSEDFTRYPRTLEQDQKLCAQAGAHLIFAPTVEEMYGHTSFAAGEAATSTFVDVPGLSDILEGTSRPGHFRGVATVVTKLFLQVQPDIAYFGQKDAQQLAVIRQMVRDLHMPIEIIGCPTLREDDGLAMSSRNRYLSPEQRQQCTVIYHALCEVRDRIQEGEKDAEVLKLIMHDMLDETPGCNRDYALIVDPQSFQPLQRISGPALAVIAARFGTTRLIDNMMLTSTDRLA